MEYDLLELQEVMKKALKPSRYLHSLGVQYTSANLAMRYHCDLMKAQVAGILHDCAKYYDDEEQVKRCKKHMLTITDVEMEQPYLLHGKLGAFYAKHKYGVEEEDILQAIIYHTTGRPEMTLLEKIVFLADYIEPSRRIIPGLEEIRQLAFEDIDKAVYVTLRNTLNYLKEKNCKIDNTTYTAYEYYKRLFDVKNDLRERRN